MKEKDDERLYLAYKMEVEDRKWGYINSKDKKLTDYKYYKIHWIDNEEISVTDDYTFELDDFTFMKNELSINCESADSVSSGGEIDG